MPVLTEIEKSAQCNLWIEIDTAALLENLENLLKVSAHEKKVIAVIKANAYGHGLVKIAKALDQKVTYLGISSIQEAVEIREQGVQTPLFLFGQLLPSEVALAVQAGITLSVSSLEIAKLIAEESRKLGRVTKVHTKIDTGMGRLGIPLHKAFKVIEEMAGFENLELEGIYTHFPTAEKEDGFRERQCQDFLLLIKALEKKEIRFIFRHAANSTGAIKTDDLGLNMIRPGLMLYGNYPDASSRDHIDLKPVLSLKSRITFLKRISPGETVGYGREFKAEHATNIATLPVGYSHGIPFRAWPNAQVLINGTAYPLAGRISMDYLCVNLGDDYAPVGEVATLIGEDKGVKITAEQLADWSGTISYEILTGLTSRIPRLYR